MLKQVQLTPYQTQQIISALQYSVMNSFKEDEDRGDYFAKGVGRTQNEMKRRFRICEKWVATLRIDKGFSVQRICSTLPRILRHELDGKEVTHITDSCIWTP